MDKYQPWKQSCPTIAKYNVQINEDKQENKVPDFKKGEIIVLGGQSGANTTVIYDTEQGASYDDGQKRL